MKRKRSRRDYTRKLEIVFCHVVILEPTTNPPSHPSSYYLNPDYVAAKAQYAGLLAQALKDRLGSETTCLFGFSLENEAAYALNALPFSSNTIQVCRVDTKETTSMSSTDCFKSSHLPLYRP